MSLVSHHWLKSAVDIHDCNNLPWRYHANQELDDLGSIRCFAGVAKGHGHVIRTQKGRFRPASCYGGLPRREPNAAFQCRINGKVVLSWSSNSLLLNYFSLSVEKLFQNSFLAVRLEIDGQSRLRPVFRRTCTLQRHSSLGTIERKLPVSCSSASPENGTFLSLAPLVEGNELLSRLSFFNFQETAS